MENLNYFTLKRFQDILAIEGHVNHALTEKLKTTKIPAARIPKNMDFSLVEENQETILDVMRKKELLTRQDVIQLLSISNATLHRWTKAGTLKSYGIGGRVYYKYSEIIDCLVELR